MGRAHFSAAVLLGKNGLLREGIAEILRKAGFHVVASVACADHLPASNPKLDSAIFFVVHTSDDFRTIVDQIEFITNGYPQARVAIVADRYRADEVTLAFTVGVKAYFVELTSHEVFIKSVELVSMGETILPTEHLSFALGRASEQQIDAELQNRSSESADATPIHALAPQLSSRELSILRCLVDGDSNKRIARRIAIAEATVKVHIKAILRKIRVSNRTQAAIWGMNELSLRAPTTRETAVIEESRDTADETVERPVIRESPSRFPSVVAIRQANHKIASLEHLVPKQSAPIAKHFGD